MGKLALFSGSGNNHVFGIGFFGKKHCLHVENFFVAGAQARNLSGDLHNIRKLTILQLWSELSCSGCGRFTEPRYPLFTDRQGLWNGPLVSVWQRHFSKGAQRREDRAEAQTGLKLASTQIIKLSKLSFTLFIDTLKNEISFHKKKIQGFTKKMFLLYSVWPCTSLVFETFMKLGKLQCKSNFNRNEVLLLMIEHFETIQIV